MYKVSLLFFYNNLKIIKMSANIQKERNSYTNYDNPQGNQDDQSQKDENKFTFKGKLISIKIKL